jgi:hypothetical protein
MVKRIFLRQVLEEIKKVDANGLAVPFDIEFRTFNSQNKGGGGLKVYEGARLLIGKKLEGKEFNPKSFFYRNERERKNPNHWQNRTRNIETPSGQIRKLNILYITKFNGNEVIY